MGFGYRNLMSIVVTPIPRLIDLAAPAFTLGLANAAGSAETAVASDSTLLVFDTTDPAAVAASAVVGSATTAPRRDHVHPGIVGAGTVADEAIARFNGTSGDSLQGYSSLSPTISDAGIISLTSGALKFPSTGIASADANTLDWYEIGDWTPNIEDSSHNASEGQGYSSTPEGKYIRIGDLVYVSLNLEISSLGSLTTSSESYIGGLPFTAISGNAEGGIVVTYADNLAITANSSIAARVQLSSTFIVLTLWDATTGITNLLLSEISADGRLRMSGVYRV
jgi:hypothetical protein